jgi:EmrB/QacA subfamily drug resistance transporter
MTRKWWTLTVVSVATFMLLLDITVVNVALPSIRSDLGGTFADVQWVIDAYSLTLAALVLTTGSLADRLGRRRLFSAGLAIFSGASLLCALAPDATFLNLARAVQGIGGAAMFAVSLALLAQEFAGGRERATAMGVYGATIGVAVAVGPLLGGALTDALGWQSIFYLNVPIGAAAIVVTQLKLRESRDPNAGEIDWGGLVMFSSALFMLVLALLRGNDKGWGSPQIEGLLSASVMLLLLFVVLERVTPNPMLPLGLFRRPSFTGVQLAAFAVSGSAYALFLYISLYLQNYLGYTPLQTGLRYLPITVASFLAAPLAGALLSRVPARLLMSGSLAVTGVGLLLLSGIGLHSGWTSLLSGFLLVGAGAGFLGPVVADVALSVVPKEKSGMAAGINDTFRQVGVAVGVAVWGAIFVARGAAKLRQLGAGTPIAGGNHPRHLVEAISSGNLHPALNSVPAPLRHGVAHSAREAFVTGFNDVMTLGAVLCLAGAFLALWLVQERELERQPLESPHERPTTARYGQRGARAIDRTPRPAASPQEPNDRRMR